MKHTTVSSKDLDLGWSASTHILLCQHAPAVSELLTKLSIAQMVELAKLLPFNREAFEALLPRKHRANKSHLFEWLESVLSHQRSKLKLIAGYVAAAAHGATAVVCEELQEHFKEISRKSKSLVDIGNTLKAAGADETLKLFRAGAATKENNA